MTMRAAVYGLAAVLSTCCLPAMSQPQGNTTIPWAQVPLNYHPTPESDEGGLWMIGEKAEAEIRTSPLLVKDPALNAHLRKIVCKLAGPYCDSIRVYIVDVPYVNAVMSPNGMLQVWTGMLLRTQNDAEMAFVLGH